MNDAELTAYVQAIRARRTSQQLINENRPTSKKAQIDAQVRSLLDL